MSAGDDDDDMQELIRRVREGEEARRKLEEIERQERHRQQQQQQQEQQRQLEHQRQLEYQRQLERQKQLQQQQQAVVVSGQASAATQQVNRQAATWRNPASGNVPYSFGGPIVPYESTERVAHLPSMPPYNPYPTTNGQQGYPVGIATLANQIAVNSVRDGYARVSGQVSGNNNATAGPSYAPHFNRQYAVPNRSNAIQSNGAHAQRSAQANPRMAGAQVAPLASTSSSTQSNGAQAHSTVHSNQLVAGARSSAPGASSTGAQPSRTQALTNGQTNQPIAPAHQPATPEPPQNGASQPATRPYYPFQLPRSFTAIDLADMRSRIARWDADLTTDEAWFDFYKAFQWGQGWIVSRTKEKEIFVRDANKTALPIEKLYELVAKILNSVPGPTTTQASTSIATATVPKQANQASVNLSAAPVGIPSTAIRPPNNGHPSAPVVTQTAHFRSAPPPVVLPSAHYRSAPPPSASTVVPRLPAQANKKRLARDVLNALGKRRRIMDDTLSAQMVKRTTTDQEGDDGPRHVPATGASTSIPISAPNPQMGRFSVFAASTSAAGPSQALSSTSGIKVIAPNQATEVTPLSTTPAVAPPKLAEPQTIPSVTPALPAQTGTPHAASVEPSSVPAAATERVPPAAVQSRLSPLPAATPTLANDLSPQAPETTDIGIEPPPPAVKPVIQPISSPDHPRVTRKSSGGHNHRAPASESFSEASTSNLMPSSSRLRQQTPSRPSSIPPPPTSASEDDEPLFLPSSVPSSPVGTPPPIIDLTHSPARPPKKRPYVLVPLPPADLKPFIDSVRKRKRKRLADKGKGKAVKAPSPVPNELPAPVEEDEYDYSYDSLGNGIDDEMERNLMNVACTRLQEHECKWEGCDASLSSNINLFEHLRRNHRPVGFKPGGSYPCRWTQCGKHVKYGDRHLMKHAFDRFVCPYKNSGSENCEEEFRTVGPLIRHAGGHTQDENELRPSCRPRAPSSLTLPPQLPASVYAFEVDRDVIPPSISQEEHEDLLSWAERQVTGLYKPKHDRARREVIQRYPPPDDDDDYQEEGPVRYRYDYLTDYTRRYGSYLSEPSENLRFDPLWTKEVKDKIKGGYIFFRDEESSEEDEIDELASDQEADQGASAPSRDGSESDWPPSPSPRERVREDRTLHGTASPQKQKQMELAGDSEEDADEAIELMLTEAP